MEDDTYKNDDNQDQPEEHHPQDDVPLWLQGLQEPESEEDEKPESKSKSRTEGSDSWIKEIDQTSDENDDLAQLSDIHPIEDDDLPEWLKELTESELENSQIQAQVIEEFEEPQDITPEATSGADEITPNETAELETHGQIEDRLIEDNLEEGPTDQGFIEISDFEIDKPGEIDYPVQIQEEYINKDKELPQWLKEMIAEPEPAVEEKVGEEFADEERVAPIVEQEEVANVTEEKEFFYDEEPVDSAFGDELEEPLVESVGMIASAEAGDIMGEIPEELIEEFDTLEEPLESTMEPVELHTDQEDMFEVSEAIIAADADLESEEFTPQIDEEILNISEDDTVPVPVKVVEAIELETGEEEEFGEELVEELVEEEEVFVDEEVEEKKPLIIPTILMIAKVHLKNHNYKSAMDTLNVYIEEGAFTDEIKSWLTEAISKENVKHPAVWEGLGDIALSEKKPDEALTYYSRSLKFLMKEKE